MKHSCAMSAVLAALVLAACGVKEEPVAAAPHPASVNCLDVEILHVDGASPGMTYMEIQGDPPRARIARSGQWGRPGDRFRYCE